ncbi:hypothetical protein A3F45_00980 [Candidatus Curtissbacteria bacterium RIFCSPHIGHO2_12_FULL_41_17]|uniref:SCP domain-containing protein n=2 Tax=Candidatus Curtissiibacteriota TaxID=1752717 RepID=A0A1F5HJ55_9BACT|nr:MAG: hypothetical protein A2693_02150 [Candidatus Curtissbacteria bacterium RIFCSPHIGHO2_01_FULL_40_12]OGE04118.1 MAG: hypothetical protein A3F45_00980 [Candidatus Curtissbacteria bacterium RIFCSPHIGHO2_12_FULL_41_17]
MHHHKLSKHFVPYHHEGKQHRAHAISLLALFGYLQILIIFTAGLYLIKLKAPEILGQATYTAAQIINLTNSKRAQNGLGPLSQNAFLDNAASLKAQNMFGEDYWAHNSPSGKTPWSFITSAGYRYLFAGENLARDFNDASSVVDAWMNSPSHRSNLLDANFKEIGVAVSDGKLTGREGTLVVQMFGSAVSQVPTQPFAQSSPSPAPAQSPTTTPKAVAKASPAPFAAGQAPSPTPEPLIAVAQEIAPTTEATVLASRRFSIAKIASLVLVGLIFTLFLVEAVVTIKRSDLQLRREVIAHLMLLGFVLIAVWYAVSGAIL